MEEGGKGEIGFIGGMVAADLLATKLVSQAC
jgi:hypothetical protein